VFVLAADQRRLSRVVEGTGPAKPRQPGNDAPVLLPAKSWRDKILARPTRSDRRFSLPGFARAAIRSEPEKGTSVFDVNSDSGKIVVLKLGGSVLTGNKAFRRVAQFLKQRAESTAEEKLLVVVSAQKLATDSLERRARGILPEPGVRALDLLWSTGELRSVALLALHLEAAGVPSVGLNVHETGLQFSTEHQPLPARPGLKGPQLKAVLREHAVVVVPGFLATRGDGAIVSLGRGGSDFSAVLLAIALRAVRCELVKNVPGYFEDDPLENVGALHLPWVSFETALRMADRGCELVQRRALVAASEADLPLVVRSTEDRAPVTIVSRSSNNEGRELRDDPVVAETIPSYFIESRKKPGLCTKPGRGGYEGL
jgi:aspartokinase